MESKAEAAETRMAEGGGQYAAGEARRDCVFIVSVFLVGVPLGLDINLATSLAGGDGVLACLAGGIALLATTAGAWALAGKRLAKAAPWKAHLATAACAVVFLGLFALLVSMVFAAASSTGLA